MLTTNNIDFNKIYEKPHGLYFRYSLDEKGLCKHYVTTANTIVKEELTEMGKTFDLIASWRRNVNDKLPLKMWELYVQTRTSQPKSKIELWTVLARQTRKILEEDKIFDKFIELYDLCKGSRERFYYENVQDFLIKNYSEYERLMIMGKNKLE